MKSGLVPQRGVLSRRTPGPNKEYLESLRAKKFSVPPSELKTEDMLDVMTPKNEVKRKKIKEFIDAHLKNEQEIAFDLAEQYRVANMRNLIGTESFRADLKKRLDERKAWHLYKVQIEAEDYNSAIDSQFMTDFARWLQGKGKEEDHVVTPWYRSPLMNDSVDKYLMAFVQEKMDFLKAIDKLRVKGFLGLDDVYEYYLYFKYIIRGGWKDFKSADFMHDWTLIFKEANPPAGYEHNKYAGNKEMDDVMKGNVDAVLNQTKPPGEGASSSSADVGIELETPLSSMPLHDFYNLLSNITLKEGADFEQQARSIFDDYYNALIKEVMPHDPDAMDVDGNDLQKINACGRIMASSLNAMYRGLLKPNDVVREVSRAILKTDIKDERAQINLENNLKNAVYNQQHNEKTIQSTLQVAQSALQDAELNTSTETIIQSHNPNDASFAAQREQSHQVARLREANNLLKQETSDKSAQISFLASILRNVNTNLGGYKFTEATASNPENNKLIAKTIADALERFQREKQEKDAKLSKSELVIRDLEARLNEMTRVKDNWTASQLQAKIEEIKKLKESHSKEYNEKTTLQEKLTREREQNESLLKDMKTKLKLLEDVVQEKERELEEQVEAHEHLELQLHEANRAIASLTESQIKNEVKAEIDAGEVIEELKGKLALSHKNVGRYVSENEKLKKELAQLRSETESKSKVIETSLQEMHQSHQAAQQRSLSLKTRNEQIERAYNSLQRNYDELVQRFNNLERDLSASRRKVDHSLVTEMTNAINEDPGSSISKKAIEKIKNEVVKDNKTAEAIFIQGFDSFDIAEQLVSSFSNHHEPYLKGEYESYIDSNANIPEHLKYLCKTHIAPHVTKFKSALLLAERSMPLFQGFISEVKDKNPELFRQADFKNFLNAANTIYGNSLQRLKLDTIKIVDEIGKTMGIAGFSTNDQEQLFTIEYLTGWFNSRLKPGMEINPDSLLEAFEFDSAEQVDLGQVDAYISLLKLAHFVATDVDPFLRQVKELWAYVKRVGRSPILTDIMTSDNVPFMHNDDDRKMFGLRLRIPHFGALHNPINVDQEEIIKTDVKPDVKPIIKEKIDPGATEIGSQLSSDESQMQGLEVRTVVVKKRKEKKETDVKNEPETKKRKFNNNF